MYRCENKLKGHNTPYLKVQPPSESWTKFISFTVLKNLQKKLFKIILNLYDHVSVLNEKNLTATFKLQIRDSAITRQQI